MHGQYIQNLMLASSVESTHFFGLQNEKLKVSYVLCKIKH
jgi:hypothetical protein